MERKQETTTVKQALIHAGFDKNNPECSCVCPADQPRQLSQECKDKWSDCYRRISEVVIAASGRGKYESEQINYSIGFFD